jgi:hypothetical protein
MKIAIRVHPPFTAYQYNVVMKENESIDSAGFDDRASTGDRNVVKHTRNAVIRVATEAQRLKKKTSDLGKSVEQRWQDSKPLQQRVKNNVQKAGKQVVDFGKDISQGVREGVAEVSHKKNEQE